MNRSEIGSVHIEQRQRRVAVGPAGGVSGMVPAHAGADVVTETPEFGLSADESAQIVGVGEDGVRVGVSDPEGFVEQALLARSEEHTSELQSRSDLVCRLLLEKKTH